MTRRIEILPVLAHGPTSDGVHQVRGQLGKGPQNKAVLEHIIARHSHRPFIHYKVIVEQQVDIKSA